MKKLITNLGSPRKIIAKIETPLAVQDAYPKDEGGYTGEVSFAMLQGLAQYSIVGHLSGIVLDSSLTLASIRQDVANLRRHKQWFEGANFVMRIAPVFAAKFKPKEKKPIDFFDDVMDRNDETFKRLSKLDSDYRDILTTISQLGATGTDIKTGRWALAVSALSLIVAIIALYVSYKTGVPPSAMGGK